MTASRIEMSFALAAALLSAGSRGLAQASPGTDWQEFRSEEGNFLLWVPAKPKELKVDGCPPGARVWQASGDDLLTVFQFGFIGHQEQRKGQEAESFLDGLAEDMAKRAGGTVASSRHVMVSGWPGRENRIDFEAGGVRMSLLDRVFVVRDVKLFVRIIVPQERAARAEHRKILDSFKLIDETRVAKD